MQKYDLVVIGGGPGGYTGAAAAAAGGMKTALVEEGLIGGTCLNRGCIPTKTLLHTAEVIHECRIQMESGVLKGEIRCDEAALMSRKDQVVARLRSQVTDLLNRRKVEIISGHARIPAPGRVEVVQPDGIEVLETDRILIAVGSEAVKIPVPGMDLPGVIDSDALLEGKVPIPESLVIVGGGVIGVELASVCRELGSRAAILEMMPQLLPGLDRELAKNLAQILKKRGIDIFTQAALREVTQDGADLVCRYEFNGREETVRAEKVLAAVGRKPRLEGLFGQESGIRTERGIVVNERFESSVPGIFAVGDVICGSASLAHAAAAQAEAAVAGMLGLNPPVDPGLIPACIYTSPEIACAGLTEDEAKQMGIPAKSRKAVLHGNARTVIAGQERSLMKVVFDAGTHRVLGAQLMCSRASDMIDEFCLAISRGLTLEEMGRIVRPHPSFCEAASELFR